jgi:branched-chain amino acid aminotransferase
LPSPSSHINDERSEAVTDPWICWNGRIVRASEVTISPLDHGVLYGDGLFETMRAYDGRVFRLDAHLERLAASAPVLHLELPWTAAELGTAVEQALSANTLTDAYLRLTVLRGVGPPGPDPRLCREPQYFVVARPLKPYPERCYAEGAVAVVATTRQNEGSPLSRVKSLSYLNHVLARVEAREAGADEALLLNGRGELAEGASSNLFALCGGTLVTPPVESGCLPGIARAVVLEIAPRLGLAVALRPLALSELLDADEAFLTNSLMEVMPLARAGDRPIGSGRPGPVTARLAAAYRAVVDEETSAPLLLPPSSKTRG